MQNADEAFSLALLAMAQTAPVLLGGLDLSVGAVMTMVNCLASHLVIGNTFAITSGIFVCLVSGTVFGLINGLIVVYGRLQPIIVTLASGAIAVPIGNPKWLTSPRESVDSRPDGRARRVDLRTIPVADGVAR